MVVNHFKMRGDIISYNLAGMGCSAGVIAIGLAERILRTEPGKYALVVSTENITQVCCLAPVLIKRLGMIVSLSSTPLQCLGSVNQSEDIPLGMKRGLDKGYGGLLIKVMHGALGYALHCWRRFWAAFAGVSGLENGCMVLGLWWRSFYVQHL